MSRRKQTRYTARETRELAAAEGKQYDALVLKFGGTKTFSKGTKWEHQGPHEKKWSRFSPAERSPIRFEHLPVGTYFVFDNPSQKAFPYKGLVLRKADKDHAVTVRKPGTPPPAEWLGISEEEFFAPFEVEGYMGVRVRDEPK